MNTLRTRSGILVVTAALIAVVARFGSTIQARQTAQPPPRAVAIDIDNFRFGVVSLEIAAGTTVTWTNRDDIPHTVASVTKIFRSPPLDTGETFSYTFRDVGSFEYYCSMHPRMTGRIVVK